RPDLQYSYASSDRNEFFSSNLSRNYNTRVLYSLSPFENKSYKPLAFSEKWKYMPSFLSGMDLTPYPDKLNLTVADLSFVRTETVNKPRDENDIPLNHDPLYSVELTHGVDLEWRLLSFFSFGYRLSADRDFDDDHGCFDKTFFGRDDGGCDGGLFARDLVFDLDGPERGAGKEGHAYKILNRERSRAQSFHTDFNPNIFSWLTMGANFNSGFQQTRNDSVQDRYSTSKS